MPIRAFSMQLDPGAAAEYRRRHADLWPELRDLLLDAGVLDYRIWLDEHSHTLFAVLQHREEHRLDALPAHPVMRRWWQHMAELMATEADGAPVQRALQPMFTLTAPGEA